MHTCIFATVRMYIWMKRQSWQFSFFLYFPLIFLPPASFRTWWESSKRSETRLQRLHPPMGPSTMSIQRPDWYKRAVG